MGSVVEITQQFYMRIENTETKKEDSQIDQDYINIVHILNNG